MDKVELIIQRFRDGDRGAMPDLVPAKFVEDTILYTGITQELIELPEDVQLDFDLYALLYRMSVVWFISSPKRGDMCQYINLAKI